MPSHYDEKAKCRVGVMDEEQFYGECDGANGAFFKSLMAAWQKQGGDLKWGAGGVGLRAAMGDSKQVGVCFLAPKFAGKQDRIELACTTLAKQIGQGAMQALQNGLREAAGEHIKGATMVSVVNPGQLSGKAQKALIATLLAAINASKS